MTDAERTFYVLVDYTDHARVEHKRGESVKYAAGNREGDELLMRGVLSNKPVRRAAGESSGRSGKDDKA